MKDSLYDDTAVGMTLAPAARSAAGAVNGTAVDIGQGGNFFRNILFEVLVGTVTDGTHTITFQGSDDGVTGWAALDAGGIQGSVPVLGVAQSNKVYRVAWDGGNKRFLRAVATVGGTPTTGGVYAVAVAMRGRSGARAIP